MTTRGGQPRADVVARVAALLAKAASTEYAAEAEALTAKAQELMARHRIEQAMLQEGTRVPRERPATREVRIRPPYVQSKALLLAHVADANGCVAIWTESEHTTTVFGFPGELRDVLALYASLDAQAAAALRRESAAREHDGPHALKRFRRSFLTAFALRVGERLRAATEAAVAAAATARGDDGADLVPVLARRRKEVDDAVRAEFPHTVPMDRPAGDAEGWRAGTAFAEVVALGVQTELGW